MVAIETVEAGVATVIDHRNRFADVVIARIDSVDGSV